MTPPDILYLFVYGTLKTGYDPHTKLCQPWLHSHQPALAQGRLYHLPMGYPAMTLEEGWVHGELLIFRNPPDTLLERLDNFEGYYPQLPPDRSAYQRQRIPVYDLDRTPLTTAWGYIMSVAMVQQVRGEWLPEGVWNRQTDLRA
ncbi:hypothetical protein BRW62_07755 [Parathermosynechococcus lividus PCC 6715]|uniref:Gamma-glutamylcyclotransferase AIG2-like domain-containing protein n=1 Tax=Parathermosynechococcus lividus PCC 6715 TaxID=1917166 RepID=A0A2D2Q2D1_PARLV|nr:gamma-glutamylcyclotransferase family protein [Thermostichus lividus]ATS18665.1 hypothetical protein BRW62_07755 [Thermostichus lividus PCC 6715]